MDDNIVQPISQSKPKPTLSSVQAAILGEMKEARLKEFRGKLKKLVEEHTAAQKVLDGKNEEIQALGEEYGDVLG